MKFCKDCKYRKRSFLGEKFSTCGKSQNLMLDPVTGKIIKRGTFCNILRMPGGNCGPEGKWFKQKQTIKGKTMSFFKTLFEKFGLTSPPENTVKPETPTTYTFMSNTVTTTVTTKPATKKTPVKKPRTPKAKAPVKTKSPK